MKKQPSKLEMAILSLLWEKGEMTAREVLESLPDEKERAYTSVLSVLQAMERKKLVHHIVRGHTNVYHALVAQQTTVGRALRDMVRDIFGGSPTAAVQHLLNESDISEADLCEVETLIAELRSQKKLQKEEGIRFFRCNHACVR